MATTRIFIVTPCLNAGDTIERTIVSVLGQAGDFEIFHHVQDGGSDDGTLEILSLWESRIKNELFPVLCGKVHFSFESQPDRSMYDGIAKGFGRFNINPDDWMGWINADDILAYGAGSLLSKIDQELAHVNWIGGKSAIIRNDIVVAESNRPVNAEILRQGLCDGVHWEFLQQEGTFFRNALWRRIKPDASFGKFKLAGDWNLWRQFAGHEAFYQARFPMGYFRQHKDQLSDRDRKTYQLEMDSVVPPLERRKKLGALDRAKLDQNVIHFDLATGKVSEKVRSLENHYEYRRGLIFGFDSTSTGKAANDSAWSRQKKIIEFAHKQISQHLSNTSADGPIRAGGAVPDPNIVAVDNIVGYDDHWQFPAITEKHAFKKAIKLLPIVDDIYYVGFPWATLIDRLNNNSDDGPELLGKLLSLNLPEKRPARIVTVSQHILTLQYRQLFFEAGVTDIYWSHAIKDQPFVRDGRKIQIHPFPLYPVQVTTSDEWNKDEDRKYLYSFIGAKSNEWYLTKVRDWILEYLPDDGRGLVLGRDTWHYNKVVYEHQIRKRAAEGEQLIDDQASLQFSQVMKDSVFALCPSGSGPNSIRLWEAIGMGAIPVVLADTYAPPGDPELWRAAAVFCKETPDAVRALPDRLEEIAKDKNLIRQKRKLLKQLWLLYGPDTFIYDIQKLFYSAKAKSHLRYSEIQSIARLLNDNETVSSADYDHFLDICTTRLLLNEKSFNDLINTDNDVRSMCALALHERGLSMAAQRFRLAQDAVLEASAQIAPAANHWKSKVKVSLFGKHSHRTPLSYDAYRPYFEANIAITTDQKKADFIVSGFDRDFRGDLDLLSNHAKERPQTHFLILSEEPLWDTLWSEKYSEKVNHFRERAGELRYKIVNHFNSPIFNFDKIPYFVTTNNHFLVRYANCFRRNSALTVDELLHHWNGNLTRAAFFAEKRDNEKYDYHLPDRDVYGLSVYRTRLAQNVSDGAAVRVGKGWSDQKMRQRLPDWHLDKLIAVDRRVLILSGLENTHQHQYITEKILDAFAALAVPLYYASPKHRVHDLLPEGGFINLYGASIEEAVQRIDSFVPDRDFARAYMESQKRLHALFSDPEHVHRERSRVAAAVIRELRQFNP